MKVVFPTCCGVDVHKSFLAATIIKTPKDSLQPSYQKKRFSTFDAALNRFSGWLHENNCLDVYMESTGKYWLPVFNILEKRDIRVVIAHPKWVKAVNPYFAGIDPLPLQTHFNEKQRKEPLPECFHCLQCGT